MIAKRSHFASSSVLPEFPLLAIPAFSVKYDDDPGILRYSLRFSRPRTRAMNSNASHPLPRANTGSAVKNWVSNTLVFLVQMERRIDHWIRPPFDFLFRDLTARVVTALINSKRKDEGLEDRRGKAAS